MPEVEVLRGRRVVAATAAIDGAEFPAGALVLRLAPDDVLVVGDGLISVSDRDATIEPDTGWSALAVSEERALAILVRHAAWEPPIQRPVLAQGMVAGLPAKVLLDGERSMVIVATPYAHELEERLA